MPVVSQNGNRVRRDVPWTIQLSVLMPGGIKMAPPIVFALGLLVFSIFVPLSDYGHFWKFLGPLRTAKGVITGVRETCNQDGDQQVYAVEYTFTPLGYAKPVAGVSYRVGPSTQPGVLAVTVEYNPAHPSYSRIMGLRSGQYDWVVSSFFLLFPLIGSIGVFAFLFSGLKAIKMMKHGVPVMGTLTSCKETATAVNDRQVMRLFFDFDTPDGRRFTASLTRLELKKAWRKFLNKKENSTLTPPQELVLYNPINPKRSYLPVEMGDDVNISPDGSVSSDTPVTGSIVLLALVVVGVVGSVIIMMR